MLLKYWRLIVFVLVVIALLGGIFWLVNKFIIQKIFDGGETKNYQVLVKTYDDKLSDPEEDRRSSMKKGYVVGVYEENHQWSDSEKVSYLILKMSLNEKEVQKITEQVKEEIDIKTLPEEQQKMMKEQKKEERNPDDLTRVVLARKYKIDLEKIGFSDMNVLLQGQPFEGQVFDWEIVEKIE
jgi:hypothetical protein